MLSHTHTPNKLLQLLLSRLPEAVVSSKPYKPPLIAGVGGVDNPKPVQGLKFGWEGGHRRLGPQPLHGRVDSALAAKTLNHKP